MVDFGWTVSKSPTPLNPFAMTTFIEDYLNDPSQAISSARTRLPETNWYDTIDDESIYSQLASGEFRLYEEIVLSQPYGDSPRAESYAVVA